MTHSRSNTNHLAIVCNPLFVVRACLSTTNSFDNSIITGHPVNFVIKDIYVNCSNDYSHSGSRYHNSDILVETGKNQHRETARQREEKREEKGEQFEHSRAYTRKKEYREEKGISSV